MFCVRDPAMDSPPRPARELTRRYGGAIHDRCDLVERHAEHIVQHERESFRRLERLQYHEERQSDRVGDDGIGLGIVGARDHGIGYVRTVDTLRILSTLSILSKRLFAARSPR